MLRTWLRTFVRDSILAGVNDAVDALANGDQAGPDPLAALRQRLLPAPAAEEAEAPARGRKQKES